MKVKDLFGKFISAVPVHFMYKNGTVYGTFDFKDETDFATTLSGSCYEDLEITKVIFIPTSIIIMSSDAE